MDDGLTPPKSISYKKLISFLRISSKDIDIKESNKIDKSNNLEELYLMLDEYKSISDKIIRTIESNREDLVKDLSPKQALSIGAFIAYLKLSIQALISIPRN